MFPLNSSPLLLIKKTKIGKIKIEQCNREFCAYLRRKKSQLMYREIKEFLPEESLNFYKNIISSFHRDEILVKRRLNLVFLMNDKTLKFCNCDIRISTVEMERYCVIKVNQKIYFEPNGNILVNRSLDIFGFDSSCWNIFNTDLKECDNLKDISPSLQNIDILNENTQFFEILINNYEKKRIKVRIIKMSDSPYYLVNVDFDIANRKTKEIKLEKISQKTNDFRFSISAALNYEGKFHENEKRGRFSSIYSMKRTHSVISQFLKKLERGIKERD